jgi:hypothetical protein
MHAKAAQHRCSKSIEQLDYICFNRARSDALSHWLRASFLFLADVSKLRAKGPDLK